MSDSPSMIVIACACGQKMKVPENAAGRTFKCVRCGNHLETGAASGGAAAPQAPANISPTTDVSPPPAEEPIGQRLMDSGLITQEQLNDALAKQRVQGGKTFELLIALGHLDKDKLHDFLSRQPGIATIDLSRCNISPDLVKLIPKKLAIENLVLPIDQLGKLLTVAMACPLDVGTIAILEKATGLRVKGMLCKLEDIHNAVQKYYPERSRFEMSPSHFDNILGAAEGPKEKVEDKVAAWTGVFIDAAGKKALLDAVASESPLDTVAGMVRKDPTLGAFLMRVANSELYGLSGQVESVPMAIAVLGKSGMLGVLENVLEPVMPKILEPLAPMVGQSQLTAEIARALAREGGALGEHAAHTLGLLGEIGRLALSTISPVKYKRVKSHLFGTELSASEHKLFSMDHCEVGGALAEAWRFPPHLAKAIRYYGEPEEAKGAESAARLLALALALTYTPPEKTDALLVAQAVAVNHLKVDAGRVAPLVEEARATLADAKGT